MKRILIIGIIVAVMSSLVAFVVPVFAHGPADGDSGTDQGTWQAMYEACEEGDWDAMIEAAEEVHGNFDDAPCHDDEYLDSEYSNHDDWRGMMDGHLSDWGGMMGW